MSLFPHEHIRPIQQDFIKTINEALEKKRSVIIDAPTGIGKTAGALAPTLSFALENNKTVFFLTSRHTQHRLVIDTVREIMHKHGKRIIVADLIAKKHMCAQDGADAFHSGEFVEYCKRLRENNMCEYYTNFKSGQKLSPRSEKVISDITHSKPLHTEELVSSCKSAGVCPYEIAGQVASQANLIVCDYSLIFHPQMRASLLGRMKKDLTGAIIVIDEAHNLAPRLRDMMSSRVSTIAIMRAQKEAAKLEDEELSEALAGMRQNLEELGNSVEFERTVSKEELLECIETDDLEEFTSKLEKAAQIVRETQQHSSLGALAEFLNLWTSDETGFVRVLAKQKIRGEIVLTVRHRALDPSSWTAPVLTQAHSTIAMSGTLTPTFMYRDILGLDETSAQVNLPSPFPSENRLTMVVPEVTTKYTSRSPAMYEKIASICAKISNSVPGNVAIFFPSYHLRDDIHRLFHSQSRKRFFLEMQEFTKKEKTDFLEEFKASTPNGVLLGVTGGNFSEGVDIQGNILKAVIIVGLPLEHPDLETKALIDYYDKLFGRGWEYGYLIPAFNKAIQSAGRCIRSGTDRGAMIFLDERYGWPAYRKYFPSKWSVKVTKEYMQEVSTFFRQGTKQENNSENLSIYDL